jgi:O-antigen ligase
MDATATAADTSLSLPRRTVVSWMTIVVLTGVFFFSEHWNSQVSALHDFTITGDEMAERSAEGDMGRRLAFPILGLFGVLLLLRRDGWQVHLQSPLAYLLLGYLAWCVMSILWSDDPSLTMRRLGVLLCCSLGALGVARQLIPRDLCLVTLVVATVLILNGVRTEIALGTFHPLAADYRFAGTLHPNAQAPYCATMALAAAFLAFRVKRGRIILWTLCATGVALLLLTKSRTVCGSTCVGLLLFASLRASWPKRIVVAGGIVWAASTVLLVVSLLGWDAEHQTVNAALMGRQDEADSLSGRVPLWLELLPHVRDRLFFGHGYLTFWSPQRIAAFSHDLQWTVPDGHCAYLDTLLDLGVIGAALCLVAIVTGIREVKRRFETSGGYGYGFLFALLACRALNALLESAFSTPTSFVPFIMVCGLLHLGYCREAEQSPAVEASPEESTR